MKYSRYETLVAFCSAMEWAPDVSTVYQRIVDISSECLECDSAHLHLLDTDGERFVCHASRDVSELRVESSMPITKSLGRMANLMDFGELIIMDYMSPHEQDVIPKLAIELGYRSAISIPLKSSAGVFGMLNIVYKRTLPWSQDDYGFLLDIGSVLGTFVQRVQMSKKDLELQMLQERKQLSSEIHDNVSQMVSALALRADIATSCLDEGDLLGLATELDSLASQARQATKMLREEMLSLRTPIEGTGDVVSDISEALARFEDQWGFEVEVDNQIEGEAVVSDYARLQLVRIVHECLQNILRHSRASAIEVTLARRNGKALISIRDDGVGFDVAAVAPERLGIRIMRERAVSAGGSLSVVSSAQGTTVFIEMPVARI